MLSIIAFALICAFCESDKRDDAIGLLFLGFLEIPFEAFIIASILGVA